MIIGVVGSRGFMNYKMLCKVLDAFPITKIVSGGAYGADKLAKKYADEHGIPIEEFIPEWDKYGKSAGFLRNQLIVEESDVIIAFWDMKSKGTKHSINIAENLSKPLRIVDYNAKRYKDKNFNK